MSKKTIAKEHEEIKTLFDNLLVNVDGKNNKFLDFIKLLFISNVNIYIEGSFVNALRDYVDGKPFKKVNDIDLHIETDDTDNYHSEIIDRKLFSDFDITEVGKVNTYKYEPDIVISKDLSKFFKNKPSLEITITLKKMPLPLFELIGIPKLIFLNKANIELLYNEYYQKPYKDIQINNWTNLDAKQYLGNLYNVLINKPPLRLDIFNGEVSFVGGKMKTTNVIIKNLSKTLLLWLRNSEGITENIMNIISCIWYYDLFDYSSFKKQMVFFEELHGYILKFIKDKELNKDEIMTRYVKLLLYGLQHYFYINFKYVLSSDIVKNLLENNIKTLISVDCLAPSLYTIYISSYAVSYLESNIQNGMELTSVNHRYHKKILENSIIIGGHLPRTIKIAGHKEFNMSKSELMNKSLDELKSLGLNHVEFIKNVPKNIKDYVTKEPISFISNSSGKWINWGNTPFKNEVFIGVLWDDLKIYGDIELIEFKIGDGKNFTLEEVQDYMTDKYLKMLFNNFIEHNYSRTQVKLNVYRAHANILIQVYIEGLLRQGFFFHDKIDYDDLIDDLINGRKDYYDKKRGEIVAKEGVNLVQKISMSLLNKDFKMYKNYLFEIFNHIDSKFHF